MWAATQRAGCYGSRLVGAGFGGAVLALVSPEEVGPFSRRVAEEYQQETRYQPNIFAVQIADGAEVLER